MEQSKMSSEKLVLLATRKQRLASYVLIPLALLPVGPVMRALLGDAYVPPYGLGLIFVMMLLMAKLSSWWARHGGEWVTSSERANRLVEEARTTSAWPVVLATMAMFPLILLAFLLIIEPMDKLGSASSFGSDLPYVLVAIVLLGAGSVLYGRRRLSHSVVTDDAPPENLYWSEMRRILPRTYLALAVGLVVGIATGLQFEEDRRFWVYAIAMLVVSQVLGQVLLHSSAPRRLYAAPANTKFASFLWLGLLLYGVPMSFFFAGVVFLEAMSWSMPLRAAFMFGAALLVCGLCGLAFGAFSYVIRRLSDPERGSL
jgi:hypothetical protein